MLKAQQAQLAQAANIDLVHIRTAEVEYFVQFFTNFGTQSALIAGFQLSTLSQVDTDGTSRITANIYWVSTTICICLSLHVLLCTVYAAVFGEGLALRGPPGSMVRAVDGMVYEQQQVILTFSINIFALGVSTISTYYVIMDIWGAHVCTAITVVAMYFWYAYCLRIYNRFKFVKTPLTWTPDERDSDENMRRDATAAASMPRATRSDSFHEEKYYPVGTRPAIRVKKSKKKRGVLSRMFQNRTVSHSSAGGDDYESEATYGDLSDSRHLSVSTVNTLSRHTSIAESLGGMKHGAQVGLTGVSYEGYVTTEQQGKVFGATRVRIFLILSECKLVWFESKRAYELNPDKPVNTRPVRLANYSVSATKESGVFCITLAPESSHDGKKVFQFWCDTYEELVGWTNALNAAVKGQSLADSRSSSLILNASPLSPNTGGLRSSMVSDRSAVVSPTQRETQASEDVAMPETESLLRGSTASRWH